MKYKYNGSDERVFPGVKITVKPGDEFDAPEGFVAVNVVPAANEPSPVKPTEPIEVAEVKEPKETKKAKEIKEETIDMSAASDHKLGDE